MKILVACEESQRVCAEFRKKGHEAYSCDIIDQSGGHPEWHIMQDVLPLLNGDLCPLPERVCSGKHSLYKHWFAASDLNVKSELAKIISASEWKARNSD